MTKLYSINCKDVGVLDCHFETEGESLESVIEHCAEHARQYHDLKGFGPEVYAKMRPYIKTREVSEPSQS